MTSELAPQPNSSDIERVLIAGDLAKLNPEQRVRYYADLCHAIGLNPMLKPFDYLNLNGKLVLYANKSCSEQLRALRNISVVIVAREVVEGGVYAVTARATLANGRTDEAIGAVPLPERGEAKANAMMKAETKAKRRVTLSICGLAMLDETETDSIPGALHAVIDDEGKILGQDGGSREAAQAVAQRKLAAAKPEVIREMNEILDQPPQVEVVEPPKKSTRKRGTVSFEALKNFGEIKKELEQYTGNHEAYYNLLRTRGYSHADEINDNNEAREIWKTMALFAKQAKDRLQMMESLGEIETVIGKRFMEILGVHGCENKEQALELTGEATQALLKDLHEATKPHIPF